MTHLTSLIDVVDNTVDSAVILHAPHGGTLVPDAQRSAFVIGDAALADEIAAMTDHATDRMVRDVSGASQVVNGLSRFVVDPERFLDEREEMLAVGMGAFYTHGAAKNLIREDVSDPALRGFHRQCSQLVEDLTTRALERHGRVVILDVHSFPTVALPYELHADEHRPELCVGFEPVHATPALLATIRDAFDGWEATDNQPFHGAYVPLRYYGTDSRVQSVMLEIRRDTHLGADGAPDPVRVRDISRRIQRIVDAVGR